MDFLNLLIDLIGYDEPVFVDDLVELMNGQYSKNE